MMTKAKALRADKAAVQRNRERAAAGLRQAKEAGYIEVNNRRVRLNKCIAYLKPNPKIGETPRARYQRYMSASTIEESLRRGATPGDIRYDISKGFLRFPAGGRVEEASLPKEARRPAKGATLGKDNAVVMTIEGKSCWVPKTQSIRYSPNPKVAGSAAHRRYAKYERATTMQQAIKLGATAGDMQYDYSQRLLSFPGGLIAEPLPPCPVRREDREHVRKLHAKWRARAKKLLREGGVAVKRFSQKMRQKVEATRQAAIRRRSEIRLCERGVKRKRPSEPCVYNVVIPTYPHDQRLNILKSHTLSFLQRQGVPLKRIRLVVANSSERLKYKRSLGKQAPNILVACPGVVEVRTWIVNHFPEGSHILSLDDDVKDVMCKQKGSDTVHSLKRGSLDRLVANAEHKMKAEGAHLWALNCTTQPRNLKHNVSRTLGLANGHFYGFINRRSQPKLLPCLGTAAEDVERSLRFFEQDGVLLRYNGYYADTEPFSNPGGLQTQFAGVVERKQKEFEHIEKLQKAFPGLIQLEIKLDLKTINAKFARIGQPPIAE